MLKVVPVQNEKEVKIPEESKVGKKLSDLTTKRLIIVVLAMLFSVPLFDNQTYLDTPNANNYGLLLLSNYELNSVGFNTSWEYYIQEGEDSITPLVLLKALTREFESDTNASNLRTSEQFISSYQDGDYVAVSDLRKQTRLDAGLSIGTTLFVCFVLATAAILFT